MELGLNFDEEDLAVSKLPGDASSRTNPQDEKEAYAAKQCPPKWYSGDVEPKFAAESAYAQRDFEAAEEHYRKALEGKTGSFKRDVMEGLCRTLLKMNKHPEALKWANELHATSHRNNEDHFTVSLGVLSEVHRANGDHLEAIACLAQIISYHPFVSDFWLQMASSYSSISVASTLPPISSKFRTEVAAFCRVRAAILLENISATVKSFVKEKNATLIGQIKQELIALKLPQELIDRMELFAVMDIYAARDKTAAAAEEKEEFQDLGRSARLKAIEEGYQRKDGSAVEIAGGRLEAFENEWFSFLVE